MFRKALKTALLTASFAIGASAVSAATLTINSVTGVWQNADDINGNPVTGEGTNAISWGVDIGNGQSGYVFDGAAPPPFVANADVDFSLGTFTHNNFPVRPPSLDTAELLVTINVAGFGDIDTLFNFAHTETTNNANPCDFAGNNNQGVNINGCADQVEATLNLASSETFTIDNIEYVFNVTGFEVGGSLFDNFLTIENASNQATLVGSFVATDSLTSVPLPASGILLLAALGATGVVRRRKNRAVN